MLRRPFALLFPLLLGQCLSASTPGLVSPLAPLAIRIASAPVILDGSDAAHIRTGALRFVSGWHLTSDTRAFGGLSSLDVDGNRVTAISDIGAIVRFRLGRFGNVSDARIDPVPEGCGKRIEKFDGDTESLTRDAARRHWWIGFEWRNVICRTDADLKRGESVARPRAMAGWWVKRGAESLVALADGTFLAIAEGYPDDGPERPAVLFDRDPTDPAARALRLRYRPPKGYSPTDVAQLPDGRLIVLNRRFTPIALFTSKLVLIDNGPLVAGRILKGRTIATLAPPLIADNFEGIAVTTEGGKPHVWLASDDNFMRWQRTLLLKFALD
ncbi:MAG: esterase-like activity of phytase family protein [Sphingomonadaceae bacterium]